ncbi:uncharacterized protein LOC118267573 [Spodoptera frugiperda]|uniref:ascorbate ferrireductase (transmembrane) n=1 Tax=Spodoptera frugiperda TaxID=7108 RepID=A0A2H1VR92_SPOFR|nr:uncharacterized protein LOC118267573 [Spodoptera frugiperda]
MPAITEENDILKTILFSFNVFVHMLVGIMMGVPMLYAVLQNFQTDEADSEAIMHHILICVPAYQVLASQALLSLCPYNTWSSPLRKTNKIRAHWVLHLAAYVMGVAGSVIIMSSKKKHFQTPHGRLGLVCLTITPVTMLTGLLTLLAHPMRRFYPVKINKLVHVLIGMACYVCSTAAVCHGFNKEGFRDWMNERVTNGFIAFTSIVTSIVLFNPLLTVFRLIYKILNRDCQ